MRTPLAIPTLALLTLAGTCAATPVAGLYSDITPGCDAHGTLPAIEELGDAPTFSSSCEILSSWVPTQVSACPLTDDPLIPNAEIRMVNFTGRSLTDLFYVGDIDTTISNIDGVAFSFAAPGAIGHAFKIDAVGTNTPLLLETTTTNGVFEPLETWVFVIDDFMNAAGLPPAPFDSLDFAGASLGAPTSTGSIVHFAIPAPGTATLIAGGALAAIRRRR